MPDNVGGQLLAMQFQLERSQWLSAEALHAAQDRQLDVLLAHAGRTVPAYRERWRAAGLDPARITAADFSALPIIERKDFAVGTAAFESEACPPQHGDIYEDSTSGSLGMPLRFKATRLHAFFWHALALHAHVWHGRDLNAKLAQIRYRVGKGRAAGWGDLMNHAIRTGPLATLPILTDVARQLDWLVAEAPTYLQTYPSNLHALLLMARHKNIQLPSLKQLWVFGEVMPPNLPSLAKEVWKVPVVDGYSSQECGHIALQCPDSDGYHVMAANVRVEVLRDDGSSCVPGETGRVVITTLHNFAMPLIRYAIGDYAEVAGPCACGRGLPHLARIMGRSRNMLRTADGRTLWFDGLPAATEGLQIVQRRLVQTHIDRFEFHYVRERELTGAEASTISARLQSSLGTTLSVTFRRHETLVSEANGKFEDIVCQLQ